MALPMSSALVLVILITLLVLGFDVIKGEETKNDFDMIDIDPHGGKAIEEAQFAIQELQKLSDSTIYTSLTLSNILSAKEQEGIYHYNTILQVELASPYFKSQKPTEIFEIIVMTHIEDDTKSFAIDEFPEMDEKAIESFWIRKVELTKKHREEAFRRLEIESILLGEEQDQSTKDTKARLDQNSVSDLLSVLDSPSLISKRQVESAALQRRLKDPVLLEEERQLSQMSLERIFAITQDDNISEYSDYQKYRAKQLLDSSMQELQFEMAAARS